MSNEAGTTAIEQNSTENTKLYNNRHIENLTKENDLFGVTRKANAISNVLIHSTDEFIDNNMLALYGNWGSGKTSVMKYIQNKLDSQCDVEKDNKKKFKTIFFEAWKYEKDNNLALSLLEQILGDLYKDKFIDEKFKDGIKKAGNTVFTFAKNILLNSKVNVFGIEMDIGSAGKETIEQMLKIDKKVSLYSQIEGFIESFKKLEEQIDERYKNIIVFVDDLDRCEPENVLNLLASLKLFFIQSEKIIYFSGIDKDAVKKAVNHRYKDVIKSEEYLEKIFDITFNMPPSKELKKVINNNFMGESRDEYRYCNQLNEFLTAISFTNPRHIKKVFNKFELLRRYKKSTEDDVFPNIEDNNNILLIIFTLYLIILHEFYNDKFQEVNSLEQKFESYVKYQSKNRNDKQSIYKSEAGPTNLRKYLSDLKEKFNDITISQYSLGCKIDSIIVDTDKKNAKDLMDIIHIFMPISTKEYNLEANAYSLNKEKRLFKLDNYIDQFENNENKILTSFCRFLITINQKIEEYEQDGSDFKLLNLFEVIKLYL